MKRKIKMYLNINQEAARISNCSPLHHCLVRARIANFREMFSPLISSSFDCSARAQAKATTSPLHFEWNELISMVHWAENGFCQQHRKKKEIRNFRSSSKSFELNQTAAEAAAAERVELFCSASEPSSSQQPESCTFKATNWRLFNALLSDISMR